MGGLALRRVRDSGSTVVRHDGKSFKPMSVPTTTPLFGISGGSSSDVLAVGGPWVGAPKPATVLRYDGKTWSQQAGPPSGPLLDVQHSGKSYHAVGAGGGQIWRFDGPAYTPVATVPTAGWLAGISSCSGTKLAVVGAHTATTPQGVVALYDTATKNLMTATVPGVSHLLDVWCDAGVIIAVGGLVEKEWLMYQKVTPKVVSCTVGSGLSCKVEPLPLRARYHNEKGGLHGIWGSSKSDLYAVGQEGALLHYDGTKWEHLKADIRSAGYNWGCEDLMGIWGSKSGLFVTSRSGVLRLGKLP